MDLASSRRTYASVEFGKAPLLGILLESGAPAEDQSSRQARP